MTRDVRIADVDASATADARSKRIRKLFARPQTDAALCSCGRKQLDIDASF